MLTQVAALWAVGATATLAAMSAYFVLGGFLYVGGLPAEVALSPAAYAVFGLAALFNPLYAAILPILIPVRNTPLHRYPLCRCYGAPALLEHRNTCTL